MKKCTYYKSESEKVRKCPNRQCDICMWYKEVEEVLIKKNKKSNIGDKIILFLLSVILKIMAGTMFGLGLVIAYWILIKVVG